MKRLLIIPFLALTLTACWETGTSEKVGVVTRLSKRGLFCKTWEAQIIRGGMNNGSGSFGQAFDFTIESDDLAKQVKDALDSGEEVKITYHTEAATFCRSDSGDDFLEKIEPFKPVNRKP